MTQPEFVPVMPDDEVRPGEKLPVPDAWLPDRPADLQEVSNPSGPLFGTQGPDQGYGLKLARTFKDRLRLAENEHAEDAVAGCLGTALKRASLFGRAPVVYDFELAYTLWGFIGDAPEDLIEFRKPLFEAASHHYLDQRGITDAVPESTLRMTPARVAASIGEWRTLIVTD